MTESLANSKGILLFFSPSFHTLRLLSEFYAYQMYLFGDKTLVQCPMK